MVKNFILHAHDPRQPRMAILADYIVDLEFTGSRAKLDHQFFKHTTEILRRQIRPTQFLLGPRHKFIADHHYRSRKRPRMEHTRIARHRLTLGVRYETHRCELISAQLARYSFSVPLPRGVL